MKTAGVNNITGGKKQIKHPKRNRMSGKTKQTNKNRNLHRSASKTTHW